MRSDLKPDFRLQTDLPPEGAQELDGKMLNGNEKMGIRQNPATAYAAWAVVRGKVRPMALKIWVWSSSRRGSRAMRVSLRS